MGCYPTISNNDFSSLYKNFIMKVNSKLDFLIFTIRFARVCMIVVVILKGKGGLSIGLS